MEIKIKVNQCKRNIDLVLKEQLVINTESQVKDVEYVENGEYEVIPDDNYLLNKVNIKVNVPIPEGYIKPDGNLDITENGTYDIKNYESANVNVPIPDGYVKPDGTLEVKENGTKDVTNYKNVEVNIELNPNLQEKTVTPSKEIQEVTADEGYDGLDKVKVDSIPSAYIVPNGELDINENGIHNVSDYEKVNVNVQAPSTEGTIINPNEVIERIYFNLSLPSEITDKFLSQLTYVQTGLNEEPICLLYACVDENKNYRGHILLAVKGNYYGEEYYSIVYTQSLTADRHAIYSSLMKSSFNNYSGWLVETKSLDYGDGGVEYLDLLYGGLYFDEPDSSENRTCLTNFQGLPVGAENEKLKNVLSTTPFVTEGQTGSKNEPITITENGTYTAPDGVGYSPVEVRVANSEDMLQARVNATNSCDYLFYYYGGDNLDFLSRLDTSKVISATGMFRGCSKVTTIPAINSENITNAASMFAECDLLTTVPLINTSNVVNMGGFVNECFKLTTIPALDVSKVTSFKTAFNQCSNLKTILMYGMKVSFNISASTQFEREDLVTILNNLATVTTTQTLTMGSTNLAKLTEEDKAIATGKGWTLA